MKIFLKIFSKRIKNKGKGSRSRKSLLTSVFGEGCCFTKLTKAKEWGVTLYDGFVKRGVQLNVCTVHDSLFCGFIHNQPSLNLKMERTYSSLTMPFFDARKIRLQMVCSWKKNKDILFFSILFGFTVTI